MLRKTLQIGFSLALLGLSAVSADAVTNLVNTVESTVTLLGHNGDGLSGYRVRSRRQGDDWDERRCNV
mgnify:CR=1 FL=1